ncbi:MAG TPA: phage tail protein [Gaiellaceae bacterium]|jgi:phage tail-like protein
MPTGARTDPYRVYNFLVEIDGITRAGFRECSGLDTSNDAIDYREGSDPRVVRKLPGMTKFTNITLKWGITDDAQLWDWRKKAMDGSVERKNGSIILLDETGAEKLRWNFREAWPTKWTGPSLNATGNEVAIETLELTHEGLVKA